MLLAWSGFFGFLMLDDALQLHERIGLWLGRRLGLPAVGGLRPDDFGEILVAGTVGASLLLVLVLAWRRDRETAWRVFHALNRTGQVVYQQRFVRHPGWDLRAFVVNGRVVAGMRRMCRRRLTIGRPPTNDHR